MTKFISAANHELLKQFIPDMYQLGSRKLFQLAILQLSSTKNLSWVHHSDISSIQNHKVHVTRLAVQTLFQNHFVEWQAIRTRKFDFEEYRIHGCEDLYNSFYRRFPDEQTQSKPEQRKNIFIYCPNFSIQYFRYNNFLYRKHLNKIICLPHDKTPSLSPEIQKLCIAHNIKILSLKQFSYETILNYIKEKFHGNILINGALSEHTYLQNPQNMFKPKEIMIFLDNQYNRRDRSNKKQFPPMEDLIKQYYHSYQSKMDSRITFIKLLNKKVINKQNPDKKKDTKEQKQDENKEKEEDSKPKEKRGRRSKNYNASNKIF